MKILVVDLNYLGDMIMDSPTYTCLRENYPEARIHVLCWREGMDALSGNKNVSIALTVDKSLRGMYWTARMLRCAKYDLIIHLNTSLRTNFFIWLMGAKQTLGYNYKHRGFLLDIKVPIAHRTLTVKRRPEECLELLEKGLGITTKNREMYV